MPDVGNLLEMVAVLGVPTAALQAVGLGVSRILRRWPFPAIGLGLLLPVALPLALAATAVGTSPACPPSEPICGEADGFYMIFGVMYAAVNLPAGLVVQFLYWRPCGGVTAPVPLG